MRGKRILWFLVMIALGALLGMLYGWVVRPMGGNASTLKALRYDYQADYVLMTAEIYAADGDLEQAASTLAAIGDQAPAQIAAQGLQSARAVGWAETDIEIMEQLSRALEGQADPPENVQTEVVPPEAEEPAATLQAEETP
jgi:hypothetical protein